MPNAKKSFFGNGRFAGCLLGICAFLFSSVAALPAYGADNGVISVTVLENSPKRIRLAFQIGQYSSRPIVIDGRSYTNITLGREGRNLNAGCPDVPHMARSVAIPNDGQMSISVGATDFYDVPDVCVAPSKGNLSRNVDPNTVSFEFGPVYDIDAFYPGELAHLSDAFILRDVRGQVVTINPIQYNPVSHVLRVYTKMTVAIALASSGGKNVLKSAQSKKNNNSAFRDIYENHFVNYTPPTNSQYASLDETGDMLIICHDAWLPNIQPLVAHKNALGINTTAIGISSIGNSTTAIKNYIQSVYDNTNLSFVLLVGDYSQITTPLIFVSSTFTTGGADPTYTKLAGDDNYPDIMIGRFSAETASHVNTQVQRTIEYELLPATQQAWFWKGLSLGSDDGPGDDLEYDYVHIAEIDAQLLNHGYSHIDELLDIDTPRPSSAQVAASLNNGRGIINYCGHGNTLSWGTSYFTTYNVMALANSSMLPFIFSSACLNGNFTVENNTCFAESWLRSTHNGKPSGAIATYMASVSQTFCPPMEAQDEFNALLTRTKANNLCSFGSLCFAGACSMMDVYGEDGNEMFDTWIVFGDPSLQICSLPSGLQTTPWNRLASEGQVGGPFSPSHYIYTLRNLNSTPIEYNITWTQPWITVSNSSSLIPENGSVEVTISINSQANSLPIGSYSDTINIINVTDHNGDTTRFISLLVGTPMPAYSWNLDTDPGWTVDGEWAFGQPSGQGGVSHGYKDPTSGFTGANVLGVNLDGDYSKMISRPYYLTSNAIDMTGLMLSSLKFKRWLNSDSEFYVHASVEISNDGDTWTQVWTNGSVEVKERTWSLQSYDISSIADNHSSVFIRWGYQVVSYNANACSGWNIDDIEIWAVAVPPPPTGACCNPTSGACEVAIQTDCTEAGGIYLGDYSTCSPNNCTQPSGACCNPTTGGCTTESSSDCESSGGNYLGNDTTCMPNDCPQPTGACCDTTIGVCTIETQPDCIAKNALYWGDNSTCDLSPCEPQCVKNGDVNQDDVVDGLDINGFVRAKLGQTALLGDNPACANYGTGSLEGDIAAFLADLLPPTCAIPGDMNQDGKINGLDINGFVRAKLGQAALPGDNPACADYGTGSLEGDIAAFLADLLPPSCALPGDMNQDGKINGLDIAGFIRVKLGQNALPSENPICANYDTGSLETDVAAFVSDLLN